MKGLPEKLVMSAIILSCGLVAHSGPGAPEHQARRATVASLHTWQGAPPHATVPHSVKLAKEVAALAELP